MLLPIAALLACLAVLLLRGLHFDGLHAGLLVRVLLHLPCRSILLSLLLVTLLVLLLSGDLLLLFSGSVRLLLSMLLLLFVRPGLLLLLFLLLVLLALSLLLGVLLLLFVRVGLLLRMLLLFLLLILLTLGLLLRVLLLLFVRVGLLLGTLLLLLGLGLLLLFRFSLLFLLRGLGIFLLFLGLILASVGGNRDSQNQKQSGGTECCKAIHDVAFLAANPCARHCAYGTRWFLPSLRSGARMAARDCAVHRLMPTYPRGYARGNGKDRRR
jgi:hypothetical protein